MLNRIYSFSPGARLVSHPAKEGDEKWLVSAYPLREVRLNDSGAVLLEALDGFHSIEELVNQPGHGVITFMDTLVHQGLLRCQFLPNPPPQWPRVEVVIPVYNNPTGLARTLAALALQDYPLEAFGVTVVDDASLKPQEEALKKEPPSELSLRWVRLENNAGPATARNVGAVMATRTAKPDPDNPEKDRESELKPDDPRPVASPMTSPITSHIEMPAVFAFVDSDAVPAPDWLTTLVAALEDPFVSAVGGRVDPLVEKGVLGRYEGACSSLNMGERGVAAGLPNAPVPYLPSLNMAVKREAFEGLGGFDSQMRLGEDVDFSWRLQGAGHGLLYLPWGAVAHDYRRGLWGFLRRKFDYARSETLLRKKHPQRFSHTHTPSFWLVLIGLCAGLWLGAQPAFFIFLTEATGGFFGGFPSSMGTTGSIWIASLLFFPFIEGLFRWGLYQRKARWRSPFGVRGWAVLRRMAAGFLAESRWLTRQMMWLLVLLGVLFPQVLPAFLGVAVLATLGEGLAKNRGKTFAQPLGVGLWWFLPGFTAEVFAYSLGRLWGTGEKIILSIKT